LFFFFIYWRFVVFLVILLSAALFGKLIQLFFIGAIFLLFSCLVRRFNILTNILPGHFHTIQVIRFELVVFAAEHSLPYLILKSGIVFIINSMTHFYLSFSSLQVFSSSSLSLFFYSSSLILSFFSSRVWFLSMDLFLYISISPSTLILNSSNYIFYSLI